MAKVRVAAVALGLALCGALGAAAPAMADAGSISGTVTDAVSHDPLAGVRVCYFLPAIAEDVCTETGGDGKYVLAGVSPGSYKVSFQAPEGVNYVTQYFDGTTDYAAATPVPVSSGADTPNVDAEMHEGGTIAGTVTDSSDGQPIAKLEVCASGPGGLGGRCSLTDSSGDYTITGLAKDPYQVAFFTAGTELNYLTQYYDGKEELDSWDPVEVEVGEIAEHIDAVMNPGAQIFGTVTEEGTGAPLRKIEVCALDPAKNPRAEEFEQCAYTDAAGNYAIRSLRAGTFVVVFSRQRGFFDADGFYPQWWNGVASASQASTIEITPPQTRVGIDAHLTSYFERPKPPQPIVVTLIERPVSSPASRCKKGFHKKKIKGKTRCVKVHRRKHRHGGHRGRPRLMRLPVAPR